MNKNLIQLIIKTITVGNVFEAISKKYNITDGGGYGENQLFNYLKEIEKQGTLEFYRNFIANV